MDGEYETSGQNLLQIYEELENVSSRLTHISGQIQEVKDSLKYYSVAGSAYKFSLNALANRIERSKNAALLCGEAVYEVIGIYSSGDEEVAELFQSE